MFHITKFTFSDIIYPIGSTDLRIEGILGGQSSGNMVGKITVLLTTFCPVTQIRWQQIMFVVTGQNVVITTCRVATALTSIAKM